jgi:hypothetical protein
MPPAVPDSGEFAIKSPVDQRASTSVGDLCRPSLSKLHRTKQYVALAIGATKILTLPVL